MAKNSVDLYLGGDLGLWVLNQVPVHEINQIITLDKEIADLAKKLHINCLVGHANFISFVPAAIGFSIHYPRILNPTLISRYRKLYNLHPGYLPWGRGYYPVFWALWENTPAGATLHEITAGIDEGPIVEQISVEYFSYDTGGSLFQRVREVERKLFHKHWNAIVEGKELPTTPQPQGGSYHAKKEFLALKEKTDWQTLTSEELIRLVRCLTFPGYSGFEMTFGTKHFELSMKEFV